MRRMIRMGEGTRPTVLLHGFLGQAKNLRSFAQRWSERDPSRRFLLLDLPGHGPDGPPLTEETDLRAMGRDVLARARGAGFEGPLELVGHSLGGRVSLAASLAEPQSVSAVSVLDITPGPIPTESSESHSVLQRLRQAPDGVAERRELRDFLIGTKLSAPLTDWLMMNVEEREGRYHWRFDREALHRLHLRVNPEDLWAAVERPGARVQCVRGGRSAYVSEGDVERMQRAGCPVTTIPGVGHFLHVEATDAVLDAVVGFLG